MTKRFAHRPAGCCPQCGQSRCRCIAGAVGPARCLVVDEEHPTVESVMARGVSRQAAQEIVDFAAYLREKHAKRSQREAPEVPDGR